MIPDAQPRGARVGEQHVALGGLTVLDHDIDRVARRHRQLAIGILELLDRNDALGLVSEVDNHVLGGNREDSALQNLIGGGWGEVAIIFEKILVIGNRLVQLPFVLIFGHLASAAPGVAPQRDRRHPGREYRYDCGY